MRVTIYADPDPFHPLGMFVWEFIKNKDDQNGTTSRLLPLDDKMEDSVIAVLKAALAEAEAWRAAPLSDSARTA